MKHRSSHCRHRQGFSLLDTVISLAVLSVLIVIFASLVTSRAVNRRTVHRATAASLADEELGVLRRLNVSAVGNQTNGPFAGVLYNAGAWRIAADGSAGHSAPNVVELPASSSFSSAASGRLQYPAGSYGTATLQMKFKIAADSPAGWGIGWLWRAVGAKNAYRARLTSTTLFLEKLVNGAATNLDSPITLSPSLTTDTWHTLQLVMDDALTPRFKVYLDGNQKNTAAIADATYTGGPAAVLGWGGVHALIDDAETVVGGVTTTWDFDASTLWPAAWLRVGLNDLPDATPTVFDDNGLLTVAPYPSPSSTNLKLATAAIRWTYNGALQSYSTSTLLGASTLAQ